MKNGWSDLLAFIVGLVTFLALCFAYVVMCYLVAEGYDGERPKGLPVVMFFLVNVILLVVFFVIGVAVGKLVRKALP